VREDGKKVEGRMGEGYGRGKNEREEDKRGKSIEDYRSAGGWKLGGQDGCLVKGWKVGMGA